MLSSEGSNVVAHAVRHKLAVAFGQRIDNPHVLLVSRTAS